MKEQEKTDLKYELKRQIIQQLNLEDLKPEDIGDDVPLFVKGLGLDSIDALELVVILEKNYQVRIPDETVGRKALHSINAMADYIEEQTAGTK
jgi:acyl carrier protein